MDAQTDMFGQPASTLTLFGECFDKVVREAGGWPDGAVAYAVEVVGGGKNPIVLVTGEVPVGAKRNGSPKFGKGRTKYKAGITLSDYRAALPKPKGVAA